MKSKTDILRAKALKAIKKLFSDTSITPKETIAELEALRDEIEIMIESINVNRGNY